MSESDKVGNVKNNPPNEKLEITVKTFFGHEITVFEESGDYKVKSTGIKGLGDKILWFFFAPTLRSRRAVVEESLKNNKDDQSSRQIGNSRNSQFSIGNSNEKKTFDDLVNREIEQAKNNFGLSDKECNEIRERMSAFKGNEYTKDGIISVVKDTIDQFIKEKYGNEDGNNNINNKLNINNHDKIYKDRAESGNMGNEFSIFGNEDNDINFVEKQNSIKGSNIISSENDIFSYAEKLIEEGTLKDWNDVLNFLVEKGINIGNLSGDDGIKLTKLMDLVEANNKNKLTKKELALIKKSEEEAAFKKEKAEEGFIEKMSNIIPKDYRVTSSKTRDKIKGDGNCFYRAIAELENEDQERYGEIRKTISDEINKSAELAKKSADKIDNNLPSLLEFYAGEYNNVNCEVTKDNLPAVLQQIKEYVEGKDKQNEYAGPIEAYFYAKATKKVVIIYGSNDLISVFIPDKDGSSVKVEYKDPKEIESYIKKNNIETTAAVKLAYNADGRHYEAIVPMNVKN